MRVHFLRPQNQSFRGAANSRHRMTLNISVKWIVIYYDIYLQLRKRAPYFSSPEAVPLTTFPVRNVALEQEAAVQAFDLLVRVRTVATACS